MKVENIEFTQIKWGKGGGITRQPKRVNVLRKSKKRDADGVVGK